MKTISEAMKEFKTNEAKKPISFNGKNAKEISSMLKEAGITSGIEASGRLWYDDEMGRRKAILKDDVVSIKGKKANIKKPSYVSGKNESISKREIEKAIKEVELGKPKSQIAKSIMLYKDRGEFDGSTESAMEVLKQAEYEISEAKTGDKIGQLKSDIKNVLIEMPLDMFVKYGSSEVSKSAKEMIKTWDDGTDVVSVPVKSSKLFIEMK